MSDYRRLISYIYEYEGKEKGKNIGFVKLETRNEQCRLYVNAKRVYVGGNAIGVYLLGQEGEKTFLGNMFVRNGCGEFRTIVNVENVEDSGKMLDTYFGLVVHDVKDSWRSYQTIWDDEMAETPEISVEETDEESVLELKQEDEEEQEVDLTGVPEVGTIWNGCIVADWGEADETGVEVLLLSLDEWVATVSQVADVMEGYSVNGISDWRLPTHEEASVLRARFSGNGLDELNERIDEYDSGLLSIADGEDERYLCTKNGTYYSFRFVSGTTTTKAGEVRSYYLRLVKSYRISLD